MVERLGVECDGRFFELNSFEVGVSGRTRGRRADRCQVLPTDACPTRRFWKNTPFWTSWLAELPVAAPVRDVLGRSLIDVDLPGAEGGDGQLVRYRVALFPKLRGRAPELEAEEHLEWLGRLIARMHQVGCRAFCQPSAAQRRGPR